MMRLIRTSKQRENLAANVVKRRLKLGLSQAALAETAGVHQPYISDIENMKLFPGAESLANLADALGTTPERLLKRA